MRQRQSSLAGVGEGEDDDASALSSTYDGLSRFGSFASVGSASSFTSASFNGTGSERSCPTASSGSSLAGGNGAIVEGATPASSGGPPSGFDPNMRRTSFASGQFVELFNGLGVDGPNTPQPHIQPLSVDDQAARGPHQLAISQNASPDDRGSTLAHLQPSEHDQSQLYFRGDSGEDGLGHPHANQSNLPAKSDMTVPHDYSAYGHGITHQDLYNAPVQADVDLAQDDPRQHSQPQQDSYYYNRPIDGTGAIQVGNMCVSDHYSMPGGYYDDVAYVYNAQ